MKLQRLRLAGFKSFVDPVELGIEPGLTGVVGPNGCGKSNLLEALRWAMGATSAKALRGASMEDVIFNGGGGRPPRSWAEVTLTLDNADRTAPPAYGDAETLLVSRRIDRGGGSTFRVNGREVRARDVQLLFADASTGANSPALVRQGQISELIAARPENRRRILEEAGGVSGLHGRRHEAELRLRAAEANLLRLDDVVGELEAASNRLKREARQAERYKRLAAEIRQLQAAVLHARWAEASAAADAAAAELAGASAEVERTAAEAASASTAAAEAELALPSLRDEAMTAAAVLQRLTLERDRLQAEEAQARAEAERLKAELVRLQTDRAREGRIAEDAAGQLKRLDRLVRQAEAEVAAAPERLPQLQTAAAAAESARAGADAAVETLAAELAAAGARAQAEAQRRADAESRVARARRALDQAKTDRAALGGATSTEGGADRAAAVGEAERRLLAARDALEAADAARADAARAEAAARDAAREADDRQRRLRTEARGLAELLAADRSSGHAPVLDSVMVEPGYEAALAAALGDDLQAALDPAAPRHWGGARATPPVWPDGVETLATRVRVPPELAARLARTGVCARTAGPELQRTLPPGCRLVSPQGDLWRWDGFVARAEAPTAAAVRLEQKTRLAALEAQLEAAEPEVAASLAAHRGATAAAAAAFEAAQEARRALPALERALTDARTQAERLAAEQARRDARLTALDDLIARFEADLADAEVALQTVLAEAGSQTEAPDRAGELTALRGAAHRAREAAATARSALDAESREAQARTRRLETLRRDHADWLRRRTDAARRVETLERDHVKALAAADAARAAPAEAMAKRERLLDEHGVAERRRAAAADALAVAETARAEADRRLRETDAAASAAREFRAASQARAEAAAARLEEAAGRVRETAGVEPEQLAASLTEAAVARPAGAEGMEAHLQALQRQRDAFGGVNLLAEEDAAAVGERLDGLLAERADLSGAIARLREAVAALNSEGRERLLAAFEVIQGHFKALFDALFGGGQAELRLAESDDPLEAGLEIFACPPGKRLAAMSLMSGGEQALTAAALIFAVFLANPAPICVLDEVDAPLDDANVERFCALLEEMTRRTATPFLVITHNAVTMSRMDRLYGVTMPERGVSQLLSVDLGGAERLAAE